jgi:hypothetical protein
MKKSVLGILLLLSIFTLNGKAFAQSRLSLCARFDVTPQLKSYYNSLDSVLQTQLGDEYLFRFTVMPSFDPEYALQIESVEEQYFLKVILFDKNLWYAKDAADINIDECFIELETELAELVLYLSRQFVDNKIDSVSIGGVTDGDLYQFEINENGVISCGQIWQPAPDSPLNRFCLLCAHLKDLCLTENKSNNQ